MRTLLACGFAVLVGDHSSAQPVAGGACNPVSERTRDVGCWIIAHEPVWSPGRLPDILAPGHCTPRGRRHRAPRVRAAPWSSRSAECGCSPSKRPAGVPPEASASPRSDPFRFTPETIIRADTGSDLHPGHDVLDSPPQRARGLVHGSGRDVSGDARWKADWARGRAAGDRSRGSADAPHGHRNDAAPRIALILHDTSKPATTLAHDWKPKGLCKG